jgi:hypothetical protein
MSDSEKRFALMIAIFGQAEAGSRAAYFAGEANP